MVIKTISRTLDGAFSGATFDWEPSDGGIAFESGIRVVNLPPGEGEFRHCGMRHVIDLHGDMPIGRVSLDGSRTVDHQLQPDSAGLIPAGCELRLHILNLRPSTLIFVDPTLLDTFAEDDKVFAVSGIAPIFWRQDAQISRHARIFRQLENPGAFIDELAIESAALSICARMVDISNARHGRAQTLSRDNLRVLGALDYIEANLGCTLRISDMASAACMSSFHFLRAFKEVLGQTPHQLVTRRRVETACQLLKCTDQSIADIALQSGFASQSHLTTAIRRSLGTTPAKYRLST